MDRPEPTGGLRHVALQVRKLEECEQFYTSLLGMKVEWRPDPDNVYLTSGHDNLALHRAQDDFVAANAQRLDHIGFLVQDIESTLEEMKRKGVRISTELKVLPGRKVAFVDGPEGIRIELIERS